jgi:TolB-like protein/tRNA A-37 threonylcarbamoyl transferase component Bud32/tetratricopeptide (TPR) repeat protein
VADLINENLREALADRYEIERRIAQGGMATVYLARDLHHNRLVAIKVLNTELSVAMGPERFRREIRLISTMDHPSILPLYDSGESGGSLYYVMPYVSGESLAARLQRETQLPVSEAVRIAIAVAGALEYAHKRGIVHRDVTPGNILLEDGRVLVADFGIARAFGGTGEQRLTQTGVSTGTPTYMSPEQALAEREIDGRSDVYSLGVVLYEMLVGQPPFVGPTAQAIVARQMLDDVPSLTIVRSAIPDELEDAVLRALSKTPADRYSTAAEFAEALNASLLSGGKTLGRAERRSRPRITAAQRARRSRARVRATVIAASVLLAAAVAGYGWFRGRPDAVAATAGFPPSRIAVLYFADRSRSGHLAYVADGLTENLTDELRQVKNLDVISPNGVAPFRGVDISRDSVARVLRAGTIVEGSIDEAGAERLRVEVRLIDGNSGAELGSRASFERSRTDLLGIRDTLTSKVAMLVRQRVGEEVRLRQQRAGTRNAEAWSLVQRAAKVAREGESLAKADSAAAGAARFALADSLLSRAEALDTRWPTTVIARATLAFRQIRHIKDDLKKSELIDTGLGHAERALSLDPRNAEALEIRGTLRFYKRQLGLAPDPTESADLLRSAEEDLREATTIDPSRATAWNTLSLLFYKKFNRVEANLAARRAYEEDSYLEAAPEIIWRLYATSYDMEQFVDASQWCDEGEKRYPADPRFVSCRLWLMTSNLRPPDVREAWRLFGELQKRTPKSAWEMKRRETQMLIAVPIARAGMLDSARRVIERSRAAPELDPRGDLIGAEVLMRTLIGDKDEALRLLKVYLTSHPEHRAGYTRANTWWYRSLQDDPRFKAMIGADG